MCVEQDHTPGVVSSRLLERPLCNAQSIGKEYEPDHDYDCRAGAIHASPSGRCMDRGVHPAAVQPEVGAAGIVVAVAPLALAVIASVVLYFSGSVSPQRATWQPHRVTRNGIDLDVDRGTRGNVVVRPTPSVERDDVVVERNYAAAAPTVVSAERLVLLVLAVLVFGGLASAVAMLAFPKTRLVGILLLSVGAVVIAVGLFAGVFMLRRVAVARSPAPTATLQDDASVDSNIPVESGEKVDAKSTKPAAKRPAEKAKTLSRGGQSNACGREEACRDEDRRCRPSSASTREEAAGLGR